MSPRTAKGLGLGVLLLGFAFLYLPILLLMFYSFNSSRLAMVWAGFSTRAYSDLFADLLRGLGERDDIGASIEDLAGDLLG